MFNRLQGGSTCVSCIAEARAAASPHRWLAAAAVTLCAGLASAPAVAKDIKVCLIAGKTGPLEAYAKQTENGFMLGPRVPDQEHHEGRRRQARDPRQGRPAEARPRQVLLEECYSDDKADIAVGTTGSPIALAMLPVAEEKKKVLIVEPAVANSITGDKWNRYIFRTGRSSYQDALANAAAMPGKRRRLRRHARARHRLRPRRRRRLQAGARQPAAQRQDRRRGIRGRQHARLRAVRRAPVQRAQGQAGQEDHRLHLGRPASRWPSSST